MRLFLDSHPDGIIRCPYDQLYGWLEKPVGTKIEFRVGDNILASSTYARPDLDQALASGFTLYVNLVDFYLRGLINDSKLKINVIADGQIAHSTDLEIHSISNHDFIKVHEKRLMRRNFILNNWDGRQVNRYDDIFAIYGLPELWEMEPRIDNNSELVCRHYYDSMIYDFLESGGEDAMFIEIGAGLRFLPADNVVTVEIYDYPSTDVLAVAESLPFKDSVFDGALALNVLEHVKDPFWCARELRRVVKPNGKIYVMIPFLAPEHGYPSHYFNATRFGARQLFANCEVEKQIVHPSSHPIGMLGNVLSVYAEGLPPHLKETFWTMSASELIALSENRNHPLVQELNPEVAWKIAWGTTTIFVNSELDVKNPDIVETASPSKVRSTVASRLESAFRFEVGRLP